MIAFRWRVLMVALTTASVISSRPPTASAQEHEAAVRVAFLADYGRTETKLVGLAEAFDARQFDWRPGPGVRSVREVLALLIGENGALIPESFGASPLSGFSAGQQGFSAIKVAAGGASKATIIEWLRASFAVARAAWNGADPMTLGEPHPFFGSQAPASRIAFAVMADQHEHLGQLIAYARINGVVPPWSQPKVGN